MPVKMTSKALDGGPDVDFLRPGGARLFQALDNGSGNGVRGNHSFACAVGLSRPKPWRVDLTIDDDVHDMNALRVKLTRKGLAEHPQSGLTDGQRSKSGATAKRSRGAGQRNKTMRWGQVSFGTPRLERAAHAGDRSGGIFSADNGLVENALHPAL